MEQFLKCRDVERITGKSRTSIYAGAAKGQFPKPIKLGRGAFASAWLRSEIEAWMEATIRANRSEGT